MDTTRYNSDTNTYHQKIFYLFLLMVADFIFTWIGINELGFIQEGNPILIWLFEIPFIYGLLFRGIYSAFIAGLFMFIYFVDYKYQDLVLNIGLFVNAAVLFLHVRWVIVFIILHY